MKFAPTGSAPVPDFMFAGCGMRFNGGWDCAVACGVKEMVASISVRRIPRILLRSGRLRVADFMMREILRKRECRQFRRSAM